MPEVAEMFLWVSSSGCNKNLEEETVAVLLLLVVEAEEEMFYLKGLLWVEGWCLEIELYF